MADDFTFTPGSSDGPINVNDDYDKAHAVGSAAAIENDNNAASYPTPSVATPVLGTLQTANCKKATTARNGAKPNKVVNGKVAKPKGSPKGKVAKSKSASKGKVAKSKRATGNKTTSNGAAVSKEAFQATSESEPEKPKETKVGIRNSVTLSAKIKEAGKIVSRQKRESSGARRLGTNITIAGSGNDVSIMGVYWYAPMNDSTIPSTEQEVNQCVSGLVEAMQNIDDCRENDSTKQFENRWSAGATYYEPYEMRAVARQLVVSTDSPGMISSADQSRI